MEIFSVTPEGDKDERFDNVFLLDSEDYGDEKYKTTAENCGDYFNIVSWITHSFDGQYYWVHRSSYTISVDIINKLNKALNQDIDTKEDKE